jgi:hypothetical protein
MNVPGGQRPQVPKGERGGAQHGCPLSLYLRKGAVNQNCVANSEEAAGFSALAEFFRFANCILDAAFLGFHVGARHGCPPPSLSLSEKELSIKTVVSQARRKRQDFLHWQNSRGSQTAFSTPHSWDCAPDSKALDILEIELIKAGATWGNT